MDEAMRVLADAQLFDMEIRASLAYVEALVAPGVLTAAEGDQISAAYRRIAADYASGKLGSVDSPDIFTLIDTRLEALIGPLVGKVQAGRSRTEQLLTALRLWLIEQMETLAEQIVDVQRALLSQSEGHVGALMPAYDQFRPVQVVSCGHWLLSYFWMLARDQERLTNSIGRTSISPLGSGLLAGTPYRIDRLTLAQAIELSDITQNSLDALSDWDFAAEFLFTANLISVHLSRLASDLLLYSSPSFGFVTLLPNTITATARLVGARSTAGSLFGQFAGFMSLLKASPVGYNSEAAADRATLYAAAETLTELLPALTEVITAMTLHADRMWDALDETILAADLADYLAARGTTHAQAESIVARVIQQAEKAGVTLSEMALPDLQTESALFDSDVYTVLDFSRSAAQRSTAGGTASAAVRAQIRQANTWLVDAGFA